MSKSSTKKISKPVEPTYDGPLVENPHQVGEMFTAPKELENQEQFLFNVVRIQNAMVELGNVVWFNVDEGVEKNKLYTDMLKLWNDAMLAVSKNK